MEEVDTKVKEAREENAEVDIPEETVTLELLPNIRDCVVT